MSKPPRLGLRNNQHLVTVMKLEGESFDVLGEAHPQEHDSRVRVLEQWGIDARSPRHQEPATINLPLPVRAQTAFSYQLAPTERSMLNGGPSPLVQSRLDAEPGVKREVALCESPQHCVTDRNK